MLERDMSENSPRPLGPFIRYPDGSPFPGTPPPPGVLRTEAVRTETRLIPGEPYDPRARTMGAVNRLLDRLEEPTREILNRARSGQPIDQTEARLVIGVRNTKAAIGQLTGGEERLNYDIEETTIPVEVRNIKTGEVTTRQEGIPIDEGMLEYLDKEYRRLNHRHGEAYTAAVRAGWLVDGELVKEYEALHQERNQLLSDLDTVRRATYPANFNIINQAYTKAAATGEKWEDVRETDLGSRVETEAWWRSRDALIKELGGESQIENFDRANDDIRRNREELQIPDKPTPRGSSRRLDPIDVYPVEVPEPEVESVEPEIPEESDSEIAPAESVTSLAVREETSPDEGVIPVIVLGSGGRRSESGDAVTSSTVNSGPSSPKPHVPSGRRSRFGVMYDKARDVDLTGEGAKIGEIIDGVKYKVIGGTKFGTSLFNRVKGWLSGPPMSPSRRRFLQGVLAVGAAVVAEEVVRRSLPDFNIGQGISGGVEGQTRSGTSAGGGAEIGPRPTRPSSGTEAAKPPSPPEVVRAQGPYKTVEVDIPGKGKETLNVRVLRGDEPDIFNVPAAPKSPETNQPAPVAISGAEVRRVIENPQADDDTARMIRSYLDEDTIRLVNSLPESRYLFLTKGPQGETIKEGFGSLKGLFDARWAEVALGRSFQMRSPNDLGSLKELKDSPEYKKAWRAIVADRLLRSVPGYQGFNNADHPGVVGLLSDGKEITDIIVKAPDNGAYRTRDVASLQTRRIHGTKP